jgi:hypothetical protein
LNKQQIPEKLIKHIKKRFAFPEEANQPLWILGREEKNVQVCLYICQQISQQQVFAQYEHITRHIDGQKEIEIKFFSRKSPATAPQRPWLLEQNSVQALKSPEINAEILPELVSTYYAKALASQPTCEDSFFTPKLKKFLREENSVSLPKEDKIIKRG